MKKLAAATPRAIRNLILTLSALTALPGLAQAQIGSPRYSSIVINAATGAVLEGSAQDELRYPASLTKMMTLYMAFEAVRDRRITLGQLVPISAHAAAAPPSKLGLRPGMSITVEEAILALVTKSANDAAAALGEMLGGDEPRFAQLMTLRARALGMTNTAFRNASGLPDPEQVSTARDLALLARHLVYDFPVEYRYFAAPSFVFRGRTVLNHDHLLTNYPGADGLKTGYTTASGCNLVTSAVRGNVRLIGVVLGAARNSERDLHMMALLDQGFGLSGVAVARRGDTASAQFASYATPTSLPVPPLVPQGRNRLTQPQPPTARWGVQLGAFPTEAAARQSANAARQLAADGNPRIEAVMVRGKPTTYRAQVVGMNQSGAANTCQVMQRRKQPCIILHPDSNQIARG